MAILVLGLAVFLMLHIYSTFRTREVGRTVKERIGERVYMTAYSGLSALSLGLILWGYVRVGPGPPLWQGWTGQTMPIVLMAFSTLLIVSAYAPENTIRRLVRHPMVLGIVFWSVAHLMSSPSRRAVAIFGAFGLFAAINFLVVLRRPFEMTIAPVAKGNLAVSAVSFTAFVGFGTWLHPVLFGVSPW